MTITSRTDEPSKPSISIKNENIIPRSPSECSSYLSDVYNEISESLSNLQHVSRVLSLSPSKESERLSRGSKSRIVTNSRQTRNQIDKYSQATSCFQPIQNDLSRDNNSEQSSQYNSPDRKEKCPNKTQMSLTPTLTESLSSSNNSHSGNTIHLDANRFDQVQHWNVDDGPFDLTLSSGEPTHKIALMTSEEESQYDFQAENSNSLIDHGIALTQEDCFMDDNNHKIISFSKPSQENNVSEYEYQAIQSLKSTSPRSNLRKTPLSQSFSNEYESVLDDISIDFSQSEIYFHSNDSSFSDLDVDSPVPSLDHDTFESTQTQQIQSQGLHRRTVIIDPEHAHLYMDHDNSYIKSPMDVDMEISVTVSTSFSKEDHRNDRRRMVQKALWAWFMGVGFACIISVHMLLLSLSRIEADQGKLESMTATNNPIMNMDSLRSLVESNIHTNTIHDTDYSVLLSNQQNNPVVGHGIADALDYLITCPNVKHVHVDLDEDTVNMIWPTTNHRKNKSQKIQILNRNVNEDLSSVMKTTAVLLLDEGIGLYDCHDLDQAFQIWKEHPERLVGFDGIGIRRQSQPNINQHQLRGEYNSNSETNTQSSLVKVGSDDGKYQIVSTSTAFVHKEYIHAFQNRDRGIFGCQGLGLSVLITAITQLPPLLLKGKLMNFGWDSRDEKELVMLQKGSQCVGSTMQEVGLNYLPTEDFIYIGLS